MTAGATGELIISPIYYHRSMAKRKSMISKKVQPMPLKLNFKMLSGTQTAYIDLFREVSKVSRKFIRQGQIAAIGNIRVTMPPAADPTVGSGFYISAMQNTWGVSNAWEKSFAMWNEQQQTSIEESGSQSALARFRDFKVYLDEQHWQANDPTAGPTSPKQLNAVNLGPFNTAGPYPSSVIVPGGAYVLKDGEWEYSQIVIPNDGAVGNTVEYHLMMHGADTTAVATYPGSKGMLQGYAASRSVPQPGPSLAAPVKTSWMSEMFDDGDNQSQIVDNATARNNDLPYDQDEYPGGATNYVGPENKAWLVNRSTVGVSQFNLGGMVAPCGLLRLDSVNVVDGVDDIIIEIELLPGHSRGLMAAHMQDM